MLIGQARGLTVNASSEVEVLKATFSGAEAQVAVARIDLFNGTPLTPYQVRIYINGTAIAPDTPVTPSKGVAVFQSRHFVVNPSDVISLKLLGAAGDVAVLVNAYVLTAGFNHAELSDAISKLSVQPVQYVLAPQQPQPVSQSVFAARPSIPAPPGP